MQHRLVANWKRIPPAIRKPLVLMVGIAVIGAGVVMLVFPGPGWAAIFFGLAILATEFAFAARIRDWLIHQGKQWWQRTKTAWRQRQAGKHKQ